MPPVEGQAEHFAQRLGEWGVAYLKPRFGSQGRGVRRVKCGDLLPKEGDRWVLQQAVAPPAPWAGLAVRVLVQRQPDGDWFCCPPIARASEHDPVANVERGAQAVLLEDLADESTRRTVVAQSRRVAEALAAGEEGDLVVELGLDFVLTDDLQPLLIEVNSCPRGHLEALANRSPGRWSEPHLQACMRPLRRLAVLAN